VPALCAGGCSSQGIQVNRAPPHSPQSRDRETVTVLPAGLSLEAHEAPSLQTAVWCAIFRTGSPIFARRLPFTTLQTASLGNLAALVMCYCPPVLQTYGTFGPAKNGIELFDASV
jgi:hypothetical protein